MIIQYNGYTFPASTHVEVDTQLIYDEADRVVIAKKHTYIVRSVVTPTVSDECAVGFPTNLNDGLTTTMQELRNKLEESGKELVVEGIGFGDDINVNGSGGFLDVMSGPKPRTIRWLPIGSNSVAEIIWQVEVTTSPCLTSQNSNSGLKSLNYSVAFSINQRGFTQRRISGHLMIAQSINQAGSSTDSADDYRDMITIEKITNSHREHDFTLSADKSRLDFTITDSEIESPNSYPAGVTRISAPTRSRIPFPVPGAVTVQNTFSLKLTLNAEAPRVRAWELFVALFGERVREFDRNLIIVTELDIEEDWFSNDYSFSVQYRITTDFIQFLQQSTYFDALPVTWGVWSTSMANVQRNRGLGQFKHSRTDENDRLTSLCNQEPTNVALQATEYFRQIQTLAVLCNEAPEPNRSWLTYDAQLIERLSSHSFYAATVGEVDIQHGEFNPNGVISKPLSEVNSQNYQQVFSDSAPMQAWIWKGRAVRVGHRVPPPGKLVIGGQTAVPFGDPVVGQRQIGTLFCQPVFEMVWNVGYVLEQTPVEVLENEIDPTGTNNDNTEPV